MSVFSFWAAYAVIAGLSIWASAVVTRRHVRRWPRPAAVAAVTALFLAPSLVIRGHGFGPAWMALLDARSPGEILGYGLAPLVATWLAFFAVGVLLQRLAPRLR